MTANRLMALLAVLALSTTIAGTSASPSLAHARTTLAPCIASDSAAVDFRNFVLRMSTSPDTNWVRKRTQWLVPSGLDTTNVYFVSDTQLCSSAAIAHARSASEDTVNPYPVHALRVGPNRFIVYNYLQSGDFFTYFVFDSSFSLLKALMT